MCFPDNCLKGIPNVTYLTAHHRVASHLFYFDLKSFRRSDEWLEQSVNWEDDGSAIGFTPGQRDNRGDKQFEAGVAVLPRCEVDRANRAPMYAGWLSYERDSLADNPYHGNILLRKNVDKAEMKMIAGVLAMYVSRVIPQRRDR
jgi:hypothetical protein